jgi:hypothetical protein
MGCDIHLYVEKQVDGKWISADKFTRNEDGDLEVQASYYDGRSYDLFAILADVRNGSGFAGVKTGEGFNPIAAPRGMPEDASAEYKAIADQWDGDGHSHSYFTLRELIDYDWTQTTIKTGVLKVDEWFQWSGWNRDNGIGPERYCAAAWGRDVKHVSVEEMDALCAPMRGMSHKEREAYKELHSSTYALAEWAAPYYRAAKTFVGETIPRLLHLAGGSANADQVRIVFFFDN